jgi:hypothetical protein
MLRKWILSAVAGLTLLSPLAFVPAVQAAAPESHHYEHRDHDRDRDRDWDRWEHRERHVFEVMYRPCCDAPWSCYGSFDGRFDADRAAWDLRAQGFEAFIRG